MRFSEAELKELAKSWFAISLAFGIVSAGISFTKVHEIFSLTFLAPFLFSAITVGIAFLAHELAHKFLAQKYKCFAEFRANNKMLVFAVFLSFFGFVFAAPGGVVVQGNITRDQFGRISVAGISANILISLVCSALIFLPLHPLLLSIFLFGARINIFLAMFNMLPVPPFDGLNVLYWNKRIYGFLAASVIVLLLLSSYF